MKEELRSGLLFGLIGLLAIVSLSAGLYYFADFGSPTETVASEPVPEEVSQSPPSMDGSDAAVARGR